MSCSMRDGLRKIAYCARSIPGAIGWRPYTVAVERVCWSGAEVGQGVAMRASVAITEANGQPPKVRELSNEEIALGGYSAGTYQAGPITPSFPGGGTALATLQPALGENEQLFVVLTGGEYPTGARVRILDLSADHAGHYLVRLERAADMGCP